MADQPRARVTHVLKTWPEFFQPTLNNRKRFELRRDDRPEGYQVGDQLLLKEWDPEIEEPYGPGEGGKYKGYTGREVLVRVDYVMTAKDTTWFGKENPIYGFVIMSTSQVH